MDSKDNKKRNMRTDRRNEKREKLFLTSIKARELREMLIKQSETEAEMCFYIAMPLNFYIKKIYNMENAELRSFHEWRKLGYTIRKGEQAHLFWGQPKNVLPQKDEINEKIDVEINKYKFFPISFLFEKSQVYRRDEDVSETEQVEELAEVEEFAGVEM
jgi:hypothetical protein